MKMSSGDRPDCAAMAKWYAGSQEECLAVRLLLKRKIKSQLG
jgi:hypothetical protein